MVPPRRSPPKEKKTPGESKRTKPGSKTSQDGPDEEDETPAGASVEWQVTGRDEVGGLQLQIIPTFDVERICASSVKNYTGSEWDSPKDARKFDVFEDT